ncbi:50S ribosomal protein L2 [Candidatus Kaiserbacteria bacterium CG10_big_fil_rev_8_21_14_0_10_43_70]|uniref:Large ribosomal subunit protein uL2 n=1 Tax=Candidatus Kaiserbacteria bacterium CG10_big_fil_rev_8_21_14_0_10_43_70 TaxID=1974605 RepID=A0A2H0UJI6_9BACT|nr:MAG: 50S ribosomal protein L2 [Candidatus Kaiserbacteria bacterium CG10_big_fil_rev_8_21_14_0_10_43_70]
MKKYKPTTAGRRGMTRISYKEKLTSNNPIKSLTKGFKRSVGRNSAGRITTRHKGGGHKRRYRDIDFKYNKKDIPARIDTIEYDPNRSAYIGLLVYADGEKRYTVLPQTLKVGETILVSENAPVKNGNRLPLKSIPIGTFVYNVEIKPEGGAKLARSAGNSAEVIAQDAGYTHIKMPSSEVRKVLATAWASVGEVSNDEHRLVTIGKAGRARHMGRRPTVRGSAMNPVDHPHGGGEGKGGRGHRRARSKWGKPTGKGQKTRRSKKYSNALIVRRRKVGKKR